MTQEQLLQAQEELELGWRDRTELDFIQRKSYYGLFCSHLTQVLNFVCDSQPQVCKESVYKQDFWWLKNVRIPLWISTGKRWLSAPPIVEFSDEYVEALFPCIRDIITLEEVRNIVYADVKKNGSFVGFKMYHKNQGIWHGLYYKKFG